MNTHLQEMVRQAQQAMENAYAPYSNFSVAVALITPEKKIFAGCNHENASYSLTVCAETAAIAAMITAGYRQITEMVVMAKNRKTCNPCGACRQRIAEFAMPETLIHLYGDGRVQKTYTLTELLPHGFALEM